MAFDNNSDFPIIKDGKIVRELPGIGIAENEISKRVIPILNSDTLQNRSNEIYQSNEYQNVELWMNDKRKSETAQFFPLSFRSSKDKGEWYLLPWEPLINISANIKKNETSVSQHMGTIKDRWAMDDYSITITGAFYGQKMRGTYSETYPREDMEKLRDYLLSTEAIEVKCELFQILNINRIAITGMIFPFTKGESVQAYEIYAKSDFPWDLNYKKPQKRTLQVGTPEGEFETSTE